LAPSRRIEMPARLSRELEAEAFRLRQEGRTLREVAHLIGKSKHAVENVLVREAARRVAPKAWNPSSARLSMAEREEIRAGIERGESFTAIARVVGRSVSTISREVTNNGGRHDYRAWEAHCRADRPARRPKVAKLVDGPLLDKVTEWLEEWWSPEEISRRLRLEFPDDPMMWVSHETIDTRRSLSPCLSRAAVNFVGNSLGASAPDARSDGRGAAWSDEVRFPAW
jgi:transposase, IS30 family